MFDYYLSEPKGSTSWWGYLKNFVEYRLHQILHVQQVERVHLITFIHGDEATLHSEQGRVI